MGKQCIRESAHINAKNVEAEQIDVCGNRAGLKDAQNQFSLCFDDDFREEGRKRPVFDDAEPSLLVRILFRVAQGFDGLLPSSALNAAVRAHQID